MCLVIDIIDLAICADPPSFPSSAALLRLRKAKEYNQEHDITGRLAAVAVASVEKVKEVNAEYDVTGKVVGAVKAGAAKAKAIDEEHHVVQKLVRVVLFCARIRVLLSVCA